MNKKTVALENEDYKRIIDAVVNGFKYKDKEGKEKVFRRNHQLATVLQLEGTLGLRISDILTLKLSDIIKDGSRYRLNIVEQKTGKERTFTVPNNIYLFLKEYALDKEIKRTDPLFTVGERAIQKQLKIVCDYLGLENISTHSFRKTFATTVYNNSGYNIELVRHLLQHSNSATTQRYIGIGTKQVEEALEDVASNFLLL